MYSIDMAKILPKLKDKYPIEDYLDIKDDLSAADSVDSLPSDIQEILKDLDETNIKEMLGADAVIVQEAKTVAVKSGNPYRDSNGRFGSGSSVVLADADIVNQFAESHGTAGSQVYDKLGYNDLPQVSSKKLKKPMYRYETGDNPEKYKEALIRGDRHLPEVAVLGSGTYFSQKAGGLYAFGGGLEVRAQLRANAKIGKIQDIHNHRAKLISSGKLTANGVKLASDYGLLAAISGYDAISNPTTILVMNRSALTIEELK